MAMREPLVAVIIPTFGRPEHVHACLEALSRQDFPYENFEVIVVDDGGPIPLCDVVETFRDKLNLKLVRQANAGPATARNTGATHARASLLAFTDDDCLPEPDWVSRLHKEFTGAPNCLLGGGIVNGLPENVYSSTSQMIQRYVYEYYSNTGGAVFLFNSNNMAASREQFHSLGGFSTSFPRAGGEDYDFCYRWYAAGLCTKYIPSARIHHFHPLSLWTFVKQHFNYGRGLLLCRMRMGEQEGRKLRLESAKFYLLLLLHPLCQLGPIRGIFWTGFIALSQVSTVTGAGVEAVVQVLRRKLDPAAHCN